MEHHKGHSNGYGTHREEDKKAVHAFVIMRLILAVFKISVGSTSQLVREARKASHQKHLNLPGLNQ